MDYKQGVVALTEHKDVLDRLRKMKIVRHDAAKNKDYYVAQFNGQHILFYSGEPRTFPQEIAESLERTSMTHLLDKCLACKGLGSNAAGICGTCKGRRTVIKENDEGQILAYRILKITRTYDAMLVDPAALAPVPAEPELEPIVGAT